MLKAIEPLARGVMFLIRFFFLASLLVVGFAIADAMLQKALLSANAYVMIDVPVSIINILVVLAIRPKFGRTRAVGGFLASMLAIWNLTTPFIPILLFNIIHSLINCWTIMGIATNSTEAG